MTTQKPRSSLPEDLRSRLLQTHRGLLRVHKALLDDERSRFEREHGAIKTPGEFLQIVINDPSFAWLRPISELAVQIDEILTSREPQRPEVAEAVVMKARELIVPAADGSSFQRQFQLALQGSPSVAAAYAEWAAANPRAN